jgi:shikimate dehydrogenase
MKNKLFVIGKPIKHSRSPTIHNFWIEKYSLNATYSKLQVDKTDIRDLIQQLRDDKIRGFNVTIPYKKIMVDFVDEVEPSALRSKAINTVYKVNDKVVGANTDGIGFMSSLKKDLNFQLNTNTTVMCIGAGGAAYGIISCLIDCNPKIIKIVNRTKSEGSKLIKHFEKFTVSKKLIESEFLGCSPDSYVDLLINCTSCGMNGRNPLNLELSSLNKKSLVYDIVYEPNVTPLMKMALDKKINSTNGFYMLARQAAESFYRWFGIMPKDSYVNEVIKILKNHND